MFQMPKFTIAGLLWLTVAVALGFAISQGPAPYRGEGVLRGLTSDLRWQEGVQATGCVLLVMALVSHARQLWILSPPNIASATFGLRVRLFLCLQLIAATSVLLLLRLLFERKIVDEPKHPDMLGVFVSLWPDMLLTVASLLVIRLFLYPPSRLRTSTRVGFFVNAMTFFVASGLAFWMLTDRTTVAALVHIAICGLEASEPVWLQREGVFPSHTQEGYWSFWASTIAATTAILAGGLLWLDRRWLHNETRMAFRWMFVGMVVCLGAFAWWYTYVEYPRINPDLASSGTPRHWSDTIALFIMGYGLAVGLAYLAIRSQSDSMNNGGAVTHGPQFLAMAALLIAVSEIWYFLDSYRVLYELGDLFSISGAQEVGEFIANLVIWPEFLLRILLIISAITLFWQRFRRPNAMLAIPAVSPSEFAYQFVAWSALIAVGVPALWAFSFCYWLGPFVLWF